MNNTIDNTLKNEIHSAQVFSNLSTREKAFNILQQLNEVQLQGFVSMFSVYFRDSSESDGKSTKEKALRELNGMLRPINDIDYEKELASYRNERYGT